jgi:hypothetical protein
MVGQRELINNNTSMPDWITMDIVLFLREWLGSHMRGAVTAKAVTEGWQD